MSLLLLVGCNLTPQVSTSPLCAARFCELSDYSGSNKTSYPETPRTTALVNLA